MIPVVKKNAKECSYDHFIYFKKKILNLVLPKFILEILFSFLIIKKGQMEQHDEIKLPKFSSCQFFLFAKFQ